MDDQTRSILQSLLDMSQGQAKDIAELKAANAIYHQIMISIVHNDKIFKAVSEEAKSAVSDTIYSAREMLKYTNASNSLKMLCDEIQSQLNQE